MIKIKQSILLIVLVLSFSCKSKNKNTRLTCTDFKKGTFVIPKLDQFNTFKMNTNDSIVEWRAPRDTSINKYVIQRKNNSQIEWKNRIGNGSSSFQRIKWIDECTYQLTYDTSKMKLSESQKWINDNNGIIVSNLTIEGKCMRYRSTMITKSGHEVFQDGIICVE